uniref:EMAP like 1 n=1 Tax=Myripristis murdjan TaxID=586833 RepID=A0A668AB88_9TELE
MEVTDRIASLEQRVQMQEDEIQLLKSALADVVRRLNLSEEQQAMGTRRGPTKARPMIATLPLRPTVNNGTVLPKKGSGTLPSPSGSGSRKDAATPANKKRANSNEHVGTLTRKDSGDSKGNRTRAGSTGSNCSGKRTIPAFSILLITLFTCILRLSTHWLCLLLFLEEGYVKMYLKGRPITMYMPKDLVDSYCLEARTDLPSNKLKLDWVYGYRGRDCRSNLYLLPTGETVYFIASVVVLYNVDEQLQRHYTGHTDDIKCLAVHPDKITIATGQVAGTSSDGKQLAPHVRVWDSVSLNTLHVLGAGFFDRALVCLAFSKSNGGNTLCVVDDSNDHVLSVWDWQREDRLAEVKCSNESVFAADFHPTDSNIIVTCGKSHLYFWSLEKGMLVKKQGLFEVEHKTNSPLCPTLSQNEAPRPVSSHPVLSCVFLCHAGTNRISQVIQGAHEGSIFALCMLRSGTLVSGGKDRRLISWDGAYQQIQTVEVPELFGPIRTVAEGRGESVLIGTTKNFVLQGSLDGEFTPITQGHTDELWGLAVHPWKPQFLTCGYDRQVSLWDSSSHQPIWTKNMEDAAQSAGFHPSGAVVAIGTQTGRWLVLDTDTKDLVTVHTDGNEQLSVMRYGTDGNFLAIGSHDNYIYIYAVAENGRKYSRVGKCSGHSSFITHLDWSVDSQYLVSNSGDYEILYWIPSVCKQVVSVETTRDIPWATCTCTLAFQVFGNIKCIFLVGLCCFLFQAPSHVYGGHSSHVTNVNFLYDDSFLVSTGGKDMSVMQWRIV